jgi:acetoin utilization deacetylase AcuC-like enzyme
MQLLHYPGLPGLADFGIEIPVLDTRATRTIEELEAHPEIGDTMKSLMTTGQTESLNEEDLLRAHSRDYVARLSNDRTNALYEAYELVDERGNFQRYDPGTARYPLEELYEVMLTRAAGTLQCMRMALDSRFCFYFGGGFHHAHYDFGHGFCLINDAVIAARRLQAEGLVHTVWIIDSDAHKGDGTAAITRDDPDIRTLSIHMAKGWPLARFPLTASGELHPSFIPSDVDIPIAEGREVEYAERLREGLLQLDEYPRPDIAVVLFGADPYERDRLDSAKPLRLSLRQLNERDDAIRGFLAERDIPAAYLMAGGYGPHAWEVNYQFLEKQLLLEKSALEKDALAKAEQGRNALEKKDLDRGAGGGR